MGHPDPDGPQDPHSRPSSLYVHLRQGEREAMYLALAQVGDLDALHDVVASKGVEVLDLPFPYLVVAVRNRLRDRIRRGVREQAEVLTENSSPPAPRSLWDPTELVMAHDDLRRTLEALAAMDDRDVLVIWLAAKGVSDADIASEWDSIGMKPAHPTTSAIRKRRERARAELRRRAQIGD
jgi:hypothetical protein